MFPATHRLRPGTIAARLGSGEAAICMRHTEPKWIGLLVIVLVVVGCWAHPAGRARWRDWFRLVSDSAASGSGRRRSRGRALAVEEPGVPGPGIARRIVIDPRQQMRAMVRSSDDQARPSSGATARRRSASRFGGRRRLRRHFARHRRGDGLVLCRHPRPPVVAAVERAPTDNSVSGPNGRGPAVVSPGPRQCRPAPPSRRFNIGVEAINRVRAVPGRPLVDVPDADQRDRGLSLSPAHRSGQGWPQRDLRRCYATRRRTSS